MDDLLRDFLIETNESLADLDTALLKLERTPDDTATLSLIFRLVHTIKGTCGFLGLPRLERVAHAAENVLGRVRDKLLPVTPDLVSNVLAAIDRIKLIVGGLGATQTAPEGDDAPLIAALDSISEGRAPVVAVTPDADPEPPPVEDTPAADKTIRVGVEVLEELMTLVSELVLTRNQLLQLARTQTGNGDGKSAYAIALQRLSHLTSDLQEGVMKTRMQPIGNAWNKFPRLVRDLARDLQKKVELVMLGADTELDRQVLELIRDPLTHMVRNSADHGLESPAERRAAGKPETGRITLNAYHEGGHIIVEIGDDGRGLPVGRIRAKALKSGLVSAAELAGMTEAQIQRFILRPGFSTAAAVTAVSGRGVGMDVVKTNIGRIGGSIELKSVAGQGTTFIVKIPLTLAIVSALIVAAGGQRFAIPQLSVVELVLASTVEHVDGTPVLRLRDRLLPLVRLSQLLRLDQPPATDAAPTIVVTQAGGSTLGIIVDRVFDTEEIVVKPVAPVLRHLSMFSGNTILGDGSVIMILDVNGIARAAGIAGSGDTKLDARQHMPVDAPGNRIAMLLFRAGDGAPKAVPLGLVARLEEVPRDRIELAAGQPVMQYRGRLTPLVPLSGVFDPERTSQPVLVFSDVDARLGRDRCMGLMVDEIIDVVEQPLHIELTADRPGFLGSAVIAGHATEVIDLGYWLTRALHDWFVGSEDEEVPAAPRILVVEDSDFFRHLLMPALSAAGYAVTAAPDAVHALRLRDAGMMFDAILSDIEMPELDGREFVRRIRVGGPWAELPVIALTGSGSARAIEHGRAAGFTDYVRKFERDTLLGSLRQCLAARRDICVAA